MSKLGFSALCLALSTAAHGVTIIDLQLASPLSSPTYTFYSYTSTTGDAENNIPVGPYVTFLTGGIYNNTQVQSICFDFNSPTGVGESFQGSLATPTDPSDMEATYLINTLNILETANQLTLAAQGAIDLAIWQIMNPSSPTELTPFPDDPAAQSWITQATTAVSNGSWTTADSALYPVWEPSSVNSTVQRFGLILPGITPVSLPEPGGFALIGLGLLAMAVARRKNVFRLAFLRASSVSSALPR